MKPSLTSPSSLSSSSSSSWFAGIVQVGRSNGVKMSNNSVTAPSSDIALGFFHFANGGGVIVHYYLKDSAGEPVLAVVGTERSVRHMCYVVAEEFLEICGKEGSIPTGLKWRSRGEVVDWLTSTLSK